MEGIHDLKVVERKYACLPLYPWSFKSATDKNHYSKERKPADNPIKKYVKILQILE